MQYYQGVAHIVPVYEGYVPQHLIKRLPVTGRSLTKYLIKLLQLRGYNFNSIANLRKRGKHIQVGLMTGDHQYAQIPMGKVIAHELEILGSHGMQAFEYGRMLSMIEVGKLQPAKLIGKTISLEEAGPKMIDMDSFTSLGITVIDEF